MKTFNLVKCKLKIDSKKFNNGTKMDIIIYIIALIITGATVGFASGLLGVGGGFIMVPVQFFF